MFLNIFSLSSSMKETTLFTGTYLEVRTSLEHFLFPFSHGCSHAAGRQDRKPQELSNKVMFILFDCKYKTRKSKMRS